MKKFLTVILSALVFHTSYCQQFMEVAPDSGKDLFSDFIGVKFTASDFGLKSINQNLNFRYISQNTGYVLTHNMDLRGLSNIPNIAAGVEEDYNHLIIHFFDVGIGYIQQTLDWYAGLGIGTYVNLTKQKDLLLRGTVDIFYQNISHTLGSYSDTTLYGFDIDGLNIGTFVKNVKYVNNLLCISPSLELLYRREKWDYFLGVGFNYTLLSGERISFYRTHINVNEAIYGSSGAISKGVIMPSYYIFKLGVIKEFGM